MNSVHPEKKGDAQNGYTQNGYTNGHNLKMEDITETETEAKPKEAERGKTSKEVQLEQVPRMGQPRDMGAESVE